MTPSRYMKLDDFLQYCRGLNVRTTKDELRFYEKAGYALPRVRVAAPEEAFRASKTWSLNGHQGAPPQMPADFLAVFESGSVMFEHAKITDAELVESLDRAIAGPSPYVAQPSVDQPFDESAYLASIPASGGAHTIVESRETSYYSPWQVHQLAWLQAHPLLFSYRHLLDSADEDVQKLHRAFLPTRDAVRDYRDRANVFDATWYFKTMADREQDRTFALSQDVDGVITLDEQERLAYVARLNAHAKHVVEEFGLTEGQLLRHLDGLLGEHYAYVEGERLKLAESIVEEIVEVCEWMSLAGYGSWDDIGDKMVTNFSPSTKSRLRAIDPWTRNYDEAIQTLTWYESSLNNILSSISAQAYPVSAGEIMKYCVNNELDEVVETIARLSWTSQEQRNELYFDHYRRLRNVGVAFEHFLKRVCAPLPSPPGVTRTLTPWIEALSDGTGWESHFKSGLVSKLVSPGASASALIASVTALRSDPGMTATRDGLVAMHFLLTALGRNASVHVKPEIRISRGSEFGSLGEAIAFSFLHVWHIGKARGWV